MIRLPNRARRSETLLSGYNWVRRSSGEAPFWQSLISRCWPALSSRLEPSKRVPPCFAPDCCPQKLERTQDMDGDTMSAKLLGNGGEKCSTDNIDKPRLNGAAVDPAQYSVLHEGDADILLHGNDVFYNKAQIVNRDISIAVIRAFVAKRGEEQSADETKKFNSGKPKAQASSCKVLVEGDGGNPSGAELIVGEPNGEGSSVETTRVKPLRILEALSASGLRALRYAKEIEGVGKVIATDNDKVAVESCERNIRLNGRVAASKVEAKLADARVFMLTHEKEFDVVDLDPYGSPSIFLDSAVQTVADGGLLLCTATDMAVLCGNNGEVCHSKYGSYPLRGKYCHEMALRILLACIESHANRYKRYIVPLISLSVDFYVRVFVRIYTSANKIKETPSKLSYVYQCVGCDSYEFQPVGRISYKNSTARYMPANGPTILPDCKECGKHFNMGGPMWAAPIHDPSWVHSTLTAATAMKKRYPAFDKLHSILTSVSEELIDVPLYLNLHSMSGTLKCTPPPAALFRSAVVNAGYRISGSHANPLGVKTDAPMEILWDIMRCWVKKHPVKAQATETPGTVILSKQPKLEANFMKVDAALSRAQAKGVARFLPNPEENWGPKPRAGRQITNKHLRVGPPVAGNVRAREDTQAEAETEAKRQKQEGHS